MVVPAFLLEGAHGGDKEQNEIAAGVTESGLKGRDPIPVGKRPEDFCLADGLSWAGQFLPCDCFPCIEAGK